ncbi:hypothetical protein [Piscinibacter gummiphilus]|uniref:Uncharacterized protein n=1 Tax=Piscinibacter gummiphilus TaxID=946333 RepID=A0ABZ0D1T4_9BURK|nr:hypothetical protein [Piscinibacter gummiphilus]WOB10716.1 hypothetical protein RXV79_11820 [Piscinibacter gummiphilus]
MPTDHVAAFERPPAVGENARRLADVAVLTWRRHDAALSPVIGRLGFATLYRHCVTQQAPEAPWLADAHAGVCGTDDFAALHGALGHCRGRQAALAQGALMKRFHGLLVWLIGKPLLRQALRSSAGLER